MPRRTPKTTMASTTKVHLRLQVEDWPVDAQKTWWETWCGRTVPDDRLDEWTRPSPGRGNPIQEDITCKSCQRSFESLRRWLNRFTPHNEVADAD